MLEQTRKRFSEEELAALKLYEQQLKEKKNQEEIGSLERENLEAELKKTHERVEEGSSDKDRDLENIADRTRGYTDFYADASFNKLNEYLSDGDINSAELSDLNLHYDTTVREYAIAADFLSFVNGLGPKYNRLKEQAKTLCQRLKFCVRTARQAAQTARTVYYDQTGELKEVVEKREERLEERSKRIVEMHDSQISAAGRQLLNATIQNNLNTTEADGLSMDYLFNLTKEMDSDRKMYIFEMFEKIFSDEREKEEQREKDGKSKDFLQEARLRDEEHQRS